MSAAKRGQRGRRGNRGHAKTARAAATTNGSRRRSSSSGTKNPRGGLTARGRAHFARTEGAHLKPGVRKSERDMSPADMRRKGSWAVRFYGRKGSLPPLRNRDGEPTRFALTAAAWGEPVPKTVADARRIAAKGRRLLEKYRSLR